MIDYQILFDNPRAISAINAEWRVTGSHTSGKDEARYGYGYTIKEVATGRFIRVLPDRDSYEEPYPEYVWGVEDFPVFGKDFTEVFTYLATDEFRNAFNHCAKTWE